MHSGLKTILLLCFASALACAARTTSPVAPEPVEPQASAVSPDATHSPIQSREKDLRPVEYTLILDLAGGQRNLKLRTESGDLPIVFDESRSKRMALDSFQALRLGVLQCNAENGKFLVLGCYDPSDQSFTLDHWSIEAPFMITFPEDDAIRDHHMMRLDPRPRLLRDDFKRTERFDPESRSFSPRRYEHRRTAPISKARPN